MNKKINSFLAISTLLIVGLTSCKKEYDSPPINEIPVGKKIQSINTLLSMHQGTPVKFTEDYSIFGVVTIDEINGNLYKNIFIQDNPKDVTNPDSIRGLNVRLLFSGGLYQGDYIRINLKNTVLSTYNGVFQLDSVDVDKNIVKQETLVQIEPVTVTIAEAQANINKFQGRLVKLLNVEFASSELGKTYANAITQATENRTLQDCNLNQILVRTSGYSNFAGTKVPSGKGTLTAVLSRFNNDLQLYLRSPNESQLDQTRCDGSSGVIYLTKDFNDGSITSGGWINKLVFGTPNCEWTIFGNNDKAAKVTNFASNTNTACETWLISPALNLSSSINPIINFRNTMKFQGPMLELYISTNYDGVSDPNLATWTNLSSFATWDSDFNSWNFIDGGPIDISAFKSSNVRFGFKYTGSNSDGRTWELDNISVQEN
jgi:hypothetical protein